MSAMTPAILTSGRRTSSRRNRPLPDRAPNRRIAAFRTLGARKPSTKGAPRARRQRAPHIRSFAIQRSAGCKARRSFILIAATIVAFALLWYASLRTAAASRGGVNVVAKAAFLILTCVACIAIGFFLPMAPVISALIGSAFWAGLLATAGALAGMGLSDDLLTRLETHDTGVAPTASHDKTRPPA